MTRYAVPPGYEFAAEINVTGLGEEKNGLGDVTGLADAIRSARDTGLMTYLVQQGVRVAAIVPVEGGP